MKVPTLKNNIYESKPVFKSWNEMSQKVSTKYGTNSLGEMVFWHDVLYLHDIYTLAIAESCHLDWLPALSNTYRNLPFLPAASRNPGHTGSYHGAGWLPALSNTYKNLPFLPAASRNPGHKTTVISPSLSRWWINRQSYTLFNHSESPSSICSNYYISGLALATGRFGPYGSFKPNSVRRFGPVFNQCLAVG